MPEGEKPGVPEPAVRAIATGPILPLPVNLIGVRSENSGAPIVDGQIIQTPDHQPNLVVRVTSPLVAVAVRAASVFINTLLGGLGLTGLATVTQASSLSWANWKVAAVVAGSAAAVNALQSLATIFGNLEKNHPLLTGSI